MKIEITATPTFWLYLSAEQIELISQCATAHYDSTCRASAKLGGFVYGWTNAVKFNATTPVQASFREIDTVLKCLEIGYYIDDLAFQSKQLSMTLRRALFQSNIEISKIHITLEV